MKWIWAFSKSDCSNRPRLCNELVSENRFFFGSGIYDKRRYDSVNSISLSLCSRITPSPRITFSSVPGRNESVWDRETIGAMVFIISWVSTRVSLFHDSLSFSFSSLLISLIANRVIVSEFSFIRFMDSDSCFFELDCKRKEFSTFPWVMKSFKIGYCSSNWRRNMIDSTPSKRKAAPFTNRTLFSEFHASTPFGTSSSKEW